MSAPRPEIPGSTSSSVAVAGVRFHVTRSGPSRKRKTTPVLLLHGVPQTAVCWRGLMPELARDRVVIAPDLKGLGRSESREPYDVATLVGELAALVLHEADGPVDVVGHDWGGALGCALAAARPELVRRLVDVSGPYRQLSLHRALHVPFFALPGLPEATFRLVGADALRAAFRYGWQASTPMDSDALEHYLDAYSDPQRVASMLGYYRATTRPRAVKALSALFAGKGGAAGASEAEPKRRPAPVAIERALVIWGAADPITPLDDGQAVVDDLGCPTELLAVPGVGHWPLEEAPDVVLPAIAEFLRAP